MWGKVFKRVTMDDFVYFAPQLGPGDRRIVPGIDGAMFAVPTAAGTVADASFAGPNAAASVVRAAVARFLARRGATESDVASGKIRIAYLADGPYGIPLPR